MEEAHINGGDELGDDFYEQIEAPKFVDLTAPDRCRSRDDDRYWFCVRVGCDQKHEEEMDSETIYKNFVLRVMAARSPNVRLRKALYRKDSSANVKCPLTVPAKPSKSRVSRLALISSIPQRKMVDPEPKSGPVPKHDGATPDIKKKQSSIKSKALTTPRNRKRLSNPGTFRSVRNSKPTSIVVPKHRLVAKALVFQSPKKTVKTKISAELSALCKGMKKLEITSSKKNGKALTIETSKRQLRGREVKSRVFDPLRSKKSLVSEVKSSNCLKKNNKEKEIELGRDHAHCEATESNESSDMETEEKSRNGSLEACSTTSDSTKTRSGTENDVARANDVKENEEQTKKSPVTNAMPEVIENDENKNDIASDDKENAVEVQIKAIPVTNTMPEVTENDENKSALASDDKENAVEVMNSDDQENASASDDNNRKANLNPTHIGKKKALDQNKSSKTVPMATKGMGKISKGNLTSAATCAEGLNYRKPKLTNPKPFRLRTDERQILKEANLEKKQHLIEEPLKEITTTMKSACLNPLRKRQRAVQTREKCLGQKENEECSERVSERRRKDQPIRKESETVQMRTTPLCKKSNLEGSKKKHSLGKSSKKNKETLKKPTKSPYTKQMARTPGIGSIGKKTTQLGVIKESSPTIVRTKVDAELIGEGEATPATKALVSGTSSSRSSSVGRRTATIPKEPHFHDVHMPKSCTRRVMAA